ncbi:3090_t:CDS:2 [Acaulospora colombiana]|uniref:3090_t:CDS:1 n=1 Tax=Acaulospora colombiana TaxID=27376 RepID=A0ACA9L1P1_9GLOM|nr:3090_t:CDS:2 [Acaulospora colombiana]
MNSDKNRNTQETEQTNIQRSVPDLVITLNKLATEYSNTYLEE